MKKFKKLLLSSIGIGAVALTVPVALVSCAAATKPTIKANSTVVTSFNKLFDPQTDAILPVDTINELVNEDTSYKASLLETGLSNDQLKNLKVVVKKEGYADAGWPTVEQPTAYDKWSNNAPLAIYKGEKITISSMADLFNQLNDEKNLANLMSKSGRNIENKTYSLKKESLINVNNNKSSIEINVAENDGNQTTFLNFVLPTSSLNVLLSDAIVTISSSDSSLEIDKTNNTKKTQIMFNLGVETTIEHFNSIQYLSPDKTVIDENSLFTELKFYNANNEFDYDYISFLAGLYNVTFKSIKANFNGESDAWYGTITFDYEINNGFVWVDNSSEKSKSTTTNEFSIYIKGANIVTSFFYKNYSIDETKSPDNWIKHFENEENKTNILKTLQEYINSNFKDSIAKVKEIIFSEAIASGNTYAISLEAVAEKGYAFTSSIDDHADTTTTIFVSFRDIIWKT